MERFAAEGSILYLEAGHYPLVLMTWVGPASKTTAKHFFEWHHALHRRAAQEGRRFYSISDALLAERPSPQVRKLFAEDLRMRAASGASQETEVSAVVLQNRVLRGALTAIGWLAPSMKHLHTAASMPEAFDIVFQAMRRDGITAIPDIDPQTYRSPAYDDAEAPTP